MPINLKLIQTVGPVVGLLLALVVAGACVSVVASSSDEVEIPHESPNKLPALFDFEHYKQVFAKKYGSRLEEMTRRAYVWANGLKVYISAIAFKFRRQSHYLAMNYMSDWSPEEVDRMENKVMAGKREQMNGHEKHSPNDDQKLVMNVREYSALIESELNKEIETVVEEASSKGLLPGVKLRKKRELDSAGPRLHMKPRALSLDKLMQGNGPVPEEVEVLAKWDRNPKSNNEEYDYLQMEPPTRGLIDQQVELRRWVPKFRLIDENTNREHRPSDGHQDESDVLVEIPKWKAPTKPAEAQSSLQLLQKTLSSIAKYATTSQDLSDQRPDSEPEPAPVSGSSEAEMFVDLRHTGCMFKPRQQGTCASCYAFAGTTMAEWLYCKETDKLVQFSEQYIVDCGNGRLDMGGCRGGNPHDVPKFVQNFGMELGRLYQYAGRDLDCRYDDDTNLTTVGYIRMELDDHTAVPVEAWHEVLKSTPIVVAIATYKDFLQYGGGVYDGEGCPEIAGHVMLVVGHGRQDGQEFWLIRNSYGPHWGEEGYFKLAKSAPKRCIEYQSGEVWATKNGLDYKVTTWINTSKG